MLNDVMPTSLCDCLLALRDSPRGIVFVESDQSEVLLSYRELFDRAGKLLSWLHKRGICAGNELVFQLEDNRSFVELFWACLLGGIIPVPLSVGRNADQRMKLVQVWKRLDNPFLATTLAQRNKMKEWASGGSIAFDPDAMAQRIVILEEAAACDDDHPDNGNVSVARSGDDIAYVQFSSGSTSEAKGVRLTHRNILTNIRAILSGIRSPLEGDLFFSWMPLTHDMGLIGFHLTPLVAGWTHYIMPTEVFIRRPLLWLKKISDRKISFTASPNFGYSFVLERLKNDSLAGIDLSSLRIITNGAEPISARLCREFCRRLAAHGLHPNVIFPVYGLAEASLAVTFSEPGAPMETLCLDRNALSENDAIVALEGEKGGMCFVNLGSPVADCSVKVVRSEDRHQLPEGRVGRVWIKGGNVTAGYYNNSDATGRVLSSDGWLDTGDLGFIHQGCLYLVGRAKDIIFRNGQNYYPFDLEQVAQEVTGLGAGKIAVTAINDDSGQGDQVVVFVVYKGSPAAFLQLEHVLRRELNLHFGFEPYQVVPVREIPKTTSGKVQRYKLSEKFRNGEFLEACRAVDACRAMEIKASGDAAEGEWERELAAIWREVLGGEGFGVTDSFFAVGGNSLKASELMGKIMHRWGVDLDYRDIMANASIRRQAALLQQMPASDKKELTDGAQGSTFGLSDAQQRLFYFQEMNKDSTAYNIPAAIHLPVRLEEERMKESLRIIIARHDALRTYFGWAGDLPCQTVTEEGIVSMETLATRMADVNRVIRELSRPFELQRLPLLRMYLLHVEEGGTILFINCHHIIADGISIGYFIEELFTVYAGQSLVPLQSRFRDHVHRESSRRKTPAMAQQEAYWRGQFEQGVPVLEMPSDHIRPAVLSYEGSKVPTEIPPRLVARVKAIAIAEQTTPAMVILAAYFVLLAKLAGQEDLVVGIPVAGRRAIDEQNLVGMFVRNLALRCRPEGGLRFTEFLSHLNRTFVEAFDNQDYPFADIAGKIAGQRQASHNALFDTMFVYQNMNLPTSTVDGMPIKRHWFDAGTSKYDLSLEVFEEGEWMTCHFEYRTALFNEKTVRRYAGYFQQLLWQITEDIGRRLGDLSVQSHAEWLRDIRDWNVSSKILPNHIPVWALIEAQIQKNADAVAVVEQGRAVSYRELGRRVTRLADLIRVTPKAADQPVVILLQRSTQYVEAMLAILAAGCPYLPVDVEWPGERVAWLINDCRPALIITDSYHHDRYLAGRQLPPGASVLLTDKMDAEGSMERQTSQDPGQESGIAYIMYTSGTTGTPKAVVVGQRSLSNYVQWAAEAYHRGEPPVFPFFTSPAFDLTVTSIFVPLVCGGTVIVYRGGDHVLPIQDILRDNKVNSIKLTPSHLRLLKNDQGLLTGSSALKTLVVGGEALEAALCREIDEHFAGHVAIFNEYGPTEATVGCMIHRYDRKENISAAVPIGRPISGAAIYLLDSWLHPVGMGVEGEIYIAGVCLAKGYRGDEAITREKFIDDPFVAGQIMYRTGDLGKRMPDGNLLYTGRRDEQVKLKGYRIDLKEIEATLSRHEAVAEAVVVKETDAWGEGRLHAFYTLRGEDPQVRGLRQYLSERLPAYMIPAVLTAMETFPVNGNGKTDRVALAAWKQTVTDVAPEKENENAAAAGEPANSAVRVFREILDLGEIEEGDNFFELGGDSIKAVQISARLRQAGWELPARDILLYQTLSTLVPRITKRQERWEYTQTAVQGTKGPTPIESWFFDWRFPNPDHYVQTAVVRLGSGMEHARIEWAWRELIRHHDALRINFDGEKGGLYFNSRLLTAPFEISCYDIGHETGEARERRIKTIGSACKRAVRMKDGFPLHVALIREKESQLLLMAIHHLAIDGWSWRILLADLHGLLAGSAAGGEWKLPAKTASLIDWHSYLQGSQNPAYDRPEPGTEFPLPPEKMVSDNRMLHAKIMRFDLPVRDTEFLLTDANRTYNTDIRILLIVAVIRALHELSPAYEIVMEMEDHGRRMEEIDVSRTVGWFTMLYPLSFACREMDQARQIGYIKERVRAAAARAANGDARRYWMERPLSAPGRPAGFRFNYLGDFGRETRNELFEYVHLDTGEDTSSENPMTALISLDSMVVDSRLRLQLTYHGSAYGEGTMAELRDGISSQLQTLIRHLKGQTEVFFTPSDFSAVELKEEDLDLLFE